MCTNEHYKEGYHVYVCDECGFQLHLYSVEVLASNPPRLRIIIIPKRHSCARLNVQVAVHQTTAKYHAAVMLKYTCAHTLCCPQMRMCCIAHVHCTYMLVSHHLNLYNMSVQQEYCLYLYRYSVCVVQQHWFSQYERKPLRLQRSAAGLVGRLGWLRASSSAETGQSRKLSFPRSYISSQRKSATPNQIVVCARE